MTKTILTKSEAQQLKRSVNPKKKHNVGELYPQMFDSFSECDFGKEIPLECAIIWLGSFRLDSSLFPKIKCPVCGKEEVLVPYFCGASILSGCHVIQFYCTNCKEQIATNNNSDYYHKIRDYILKNRKNLTAGKTICTTICSDKTIIV